MARVVGIGGVFFRARDPDALRQWYVEHLGIEPEDHGGALFEGGHTVWSIFPDDTDYFGPSGQKGMVNYRVDDLDAMLDQLRAAGAEVDDARRSTTSAASAGRWIPRATASSSGRPRRRASREPGLDLALANGAGRTRSDRAARRIAAVRDGASSRPRRMSESRLKNASRHVSRLPLHSSSRVRILRIVLTHTRRATARKGGPARERSRPAREHCPLACRSSSRR